MQPLPIFNAWDRLFECWVNVYINRNTGLRRVHGCKFTDKDTSQRNAEQYGALYRIHVIPRVSS